MDRARPERLLAATQYLTRIGIWEWSVVTNAVTWTDELFRIYGLEPGSVEITFESFLARVLPEDRPVVLRSVQAAVDTGRRFEHEERIVRPDGSIRVLETRGEAQRGPNGDVIGLLGTCRDVTDERRLAILADGERQTLERVASDAPLADTLDVVARTFERLNPGMMASVLLVEDGARVRHAAGPSLPPAWNQVVDGEPIGPDQGSCGTAAWTRQPVIVTDIATDPRWVRYRDAALAHGLRACWSEPILDADGTVLGTFAFYYGEPRGPLDDELALIARAGRLAAVAIKHHRYIAALAAAEEEARLVVDNALDANIRMDADGVIIGWSGQAPRVFGWTRDEALGRPLADLIVPEHLRARHRAGLTRYLANGGAPSRVVNQRVELTALHKEGHEFPIELTVTPIRRGGRVAFSAFVEDLTDRRRLEAELVQLKKTEAVGRLSAGIAHDFNNILGVVVAVAAMLKEQVTDPGLLEQLDEIQQAGSRGAQLTRQVLAFSRKQVLRPRLCDLNAVIRDLERMLRRLIRADITLETRLAQDLWTVAVDPGQIEQAIVNLVVNARDAIVQAGRIVIATENVDVDAAYAAGRQGLEVGPWVRVSVVDTGRGMDPETLGQIFEPFFSTKGGRGTGLGLATVQGIVKQSGGEVLVYSEVGRGSAFRIYLPRAEAAVSEVAAAPPAPAAAAGVAGLTVLLVEDELPLRRTVERMLTQFGCTTHGFSHAEAALRAVLDDGLTPDLLLTDLMLPGLSGRELVDRLRRRFPTLPVVMMSGYVEGGLTIEPSIPLIEKPFGVAELRAALHAVLAP